MRPACHGSVALIEPSAPTREEGLRLKPFYAELVCYRWSDPAAFNAGLHLAGPQAVADLARAQERWARQGGLRGALKVDE